MSIEILCNKIESIKSDNYNHKGDEITETFIQKEIDLILSFNNKYRFFSDQCFEFIFYVVYNSNGMSIEYLDVNKYYSFTY